MRRLKHEPIFSASILQMKKLGLRGGKKSPRAVQGQPASGLPSVELCVIHGDSLLTELLSERCHQEKERIYRNGMGWTEARKVRSD